MALSKIARAYTGHHQIVNAIVNNNGRNSFIHSKRDYFLECLDIFFYHQRTDQMCAASQLQMMLSNHCSSSLLKEVIILIDQIFQSGEHRDYFQSKKNNEFLIMFCQTQ